MLCRVLCPSWMLILEGNSCKTAKTQYLGCGDGVCIAPRDLFLRTGTASGFCSTFPAIRLSKDFLGQELFLHEINRVLPVVSLPGNNRKKKKKFRIYQVQMPQKSLNCLKAKLEKEAQWHQLRLGGKRWARRAQQGSLSFPLRCQLIKSGISKGSGQPRWFASAAVLHGLLFEVHASCSELNVTR